jgi:exopolysaccharide biosynthesis polyprenyl glycosylphosphotransferase
MTNRKQTENITRWSLRPGERRTLLFFGDFIFSWVSFAIAVYIWASAMAFNTQPVIQFAQRRLENWFYLLPIIWMILLIDSYDRRTSSDLRRTIRAIGVSALIGGVMYLVVYFTSDASLPRRGVAAFLGSAAGLTLLWRFIYLQIFSAARFMHRVFLVGAGETGQALLRVLQGIEPPFIMAGLIDDDPNKLGEEFFGYQVIGTSNDLIALAKEENVTELFVAISGKIIPETFQTLLAAQQRGIQITRMPVAYEELIERVPVEQLEADWILRSFVDETRESSFYTIAKRLLDIAAGLVGVLSLVVIGPLVSLAILIESGRPIIFEQIRAGKGGEPFRIFKFRSMRIHEDNGTRPTLTTENDDRITPLGSFLRKTHLDEWLQFINVLRGEMSLVGPRPELPEYVDHFHQHIPFYRARLLVKPGVTGWAQIHMNYAANISEMIVKLEYDLYYIKHRTLWMDLLILLRTAASVFGFRGR